MSQHAAPSSELSWDPENPHGSTSHEHHVVSWQILLLVLLALLGCTALTVGVYNLESWIESAFEISIPRWINVFGAMSIATVKAVLVCAFFMQLRYDKALNTFALLFCLVGVGLYMTFILIDLNTRGTIYEFKVGEKIVGGTGVGLNTPGIDDRFNSRLSPHISTGGVGIVAYARLTGNAKYPGLNTYRLDDSPDEAVFWKKFYAGHATRRDNLDEFNYFESLGFATHGDPKQSTANLSIPRYGLTAGLFDEVAPQEHAGGHAPAHEEGGQEETNDDNGH
ncbi:MAG: cytochrome C oxidase subunit IV family protein [Phycisphaerales bacterium]|nr:cytochrome C oxidase subunit IV family protein [Phycisphaerales bacterium]